MPDKTEYESGARKPMPKRDRDENDETFDKAAENRQPPGGMGNADNDPPRDVREAPAPNPPAADPQGDAGTDEQKPRWEGPPENRPRGYLPAKDDPEKDRDAAGENLKDPEKKDLGDALKQKGD